MGNTFNVFKVFILMMREWRYTSTQAPKGKKYGVCVEVYRHSVGRRNGAFPFDGLRNVLPMCVLKVLPMCVPTAVRARGRRGNVPVHGKGREVSRSTI